MIDNKSSKAGGSGLNLLLSNADDGKPTLATDLPASSIGAQALSATAKPLFLDEEGGDRNNLVEQRWGIIAPEGPAGDRLLALVEPLIKKRTEDQGGHKVLVYRAPPQLDQADAVRWRNEVFWTGADLREDLPRYQLILGGLDQVPFAIQQVQSVVGGYVGRLAFDDEAGYSAYIDKVLKWEKAGSSSTQADSLFFTVHDGTGATDAGYRALIGPGVELAEKRRGGSFKAREVVNFGDTTFPSRDELVDKVKDVEPSVLFTLSHGAGAPRAGWKSPEDQRRRQGAMSFGSDGVILGEDLANKPFLPGGIWFMLACYGAGTPDASAYRHWLESLSQAGQFGGRADDVLRGLPRTGDRPFIAALPQAVLRNPNGPLAFMGHIDLAWTYSFSDLDTGKQKDRPGRFIILVNELVQGHRCGMGLAALSLYFGQVNTELTGLYDRVAKQTGQPDPALATRFGHLWMLRQDLAAYMLLGDPAVRLPLGTPAAVEPVQPDPIANINNATSAADRQKALEDAASAALGFGVQRSEVKAVDKDAVERAIGQIISGQKMADDPGFAAQCGLSPKELNRLAEAYRKAGRAAISS